MTSRPSFKQGIDSIGDLLRSLIILWAYVIVPISSTFSLRRYSTRVHFNGVSVHLHLRDRGVGAGGDPS